MQNILLKCCSMNILCNSSTFKCLNGLVFGSFLWCFCFVLWILFSIGFWNLKTLGFSLVKRKSLWNRRTLMSECLKTFQVAAWKRVKRTLQNRTLHASRALLLVSWCSEFYAQFGNVYKCLLINMNKKYFHPMFSILSIR